MPSFPSEPPFITALRGVSADVASSVTFAQRLVHFLRLPPIFDRLASVANQDGVENDHRTTAVEFLRQDNDPERGGGGVEDQFSSARLPRRTNSGRLGLEQFSSWVRSCGVGTYLFTKGRAQRCLEH